MIEKILVWPNPGLRNKATPVENVSSEDSVALFEKLRATLKFHKAEGLAATQIGVNKRVIIIKNEDGNEIILVNPEIVEAGTINAKMTEGCLSFPGVVTKITRHTVVTVSALSTDGDAVSYALKGMPAVAVQHEIEHLDGIVIWDHMGKLEKRLASKKLAKIKKHMDAKYSLVYEL